MVAVASEAREDTRGRNEEMAENIKIRGAAVTKGTITRNGIYERLIVGLFFRRKSL